MHLQVQCLPTIGKYVDWACANALKNGTITVSGFGYFHKYCRFLWGKIVSMTNLGSTIHYTHTSYNKYFRLCMVSEELRLNLSAKYNCQSRIILLHMKNASNEPSYSTCELTIFVPHGVPSKAMME